MKSELGRLRKQAEKSCNFRNHLMGWDTPRFYENRITQVGHCLHCGKEAILDTNPPPNGIDISGEAVALGCLEITDWTKEIWKERIDSCLKGAEHQQDVVVAIYKLAYPRWDDITEIDGWPTIGRPLAEYIFEKCIAFDKKHHPDVFAGGLWMNNGWSVDSSNLEWTIDMSTAKATYK